MSPIYFYTALLSFLGGVGVATVVPISLPGIVWICLIAWGVLLIGQRYGSVVSTKPMFVCSVALLFFALGLLRFEVASWQYGQSSLAPYVGEEVVLTGKVVKEPDVREKTTQLYAQVEEDTILVSVDRYETVSYGDTVTVKGTLATPEAFTTDLGRTFNYPAYLLVRGVEYRMSFAEVDILEKGGGNKIISTLLKIKHTLKDGIQSVIAEPQAGLGLGLLLGVKQALGEDLEDAFRTSGIIHIVVLSGYNVMLVVTFVLFCLSFFLRKQFRILVGLVAILCFALLVGLSATVVRASVMAALILVAELLGRTYNFLRALLFAGVLMVAINPYLLLYDIGFQFSFMATLGLILVAPRLESFVSDGFSKLSLKDFFIATVATQIAVLPLLLYYIGEVSLVAVIVNVLVLPVVPVAMLATFGAGILAFVFAPLAQVCALIAHLTLSYIIGIATFFASLPLASVAIPVLPVWVVPLLYGVLGFVLLKKKSTEDTLRDWVIEEEGETGRERSSLPAHPEPPVFFR